MEKIKNMIRSIKSALEGFESASQSDQDHVARIENKIGKELPYEVKSFLVKSSEELSECTQVIFMGYEPVDLESLALMYESPNDQQACLFLYNLTSLNSDLVVGEDEAFSHIQDLEQTLEDGPKIQDLKNIVPIMSADGYYIVLWYKPDGDTEIAITTEDFCLSSIAPNIHEYLFNMEFGVVKGAFEVDEDEEFDEIEIEAPELWNERVEAIA